jgi:hypothetical protein
MQLGGVAIKCALNGEGLGSNFGPDVGYPKRYFPEDPMVH